MSPFTAKSKTLFESKFSNNLFFFSNSFFAIEAIAVPETLPSRHPGQPKEQPGPLGFIIMWPTSPANQLCP